MKTKTFDDLLDQIGAAHSVFGLGNLDLDIIQQGLADALHRIQALEAQNKAAAGKKS